MAELTPEQMAERRKINKIASAVTGAILVAFFLIYALTNDKDHQPAAETPPVALIPYKQAQVVVYLADPSAAVAPESLAATCAAAAKHYAAACDKDALSVFVKDMPGVQPWEGTRLAQCSYSRDNGGWSGDQGWTWTDVRVAPRGTTNQEREMKRLWGQLRDQHQENGGTDEDALSAEIGRRMGIAPEQVTLAVFMLDDFDITPYAGIQAQGPVE